MIPEYNGTLYQVETSLNKLRTNKVEVKCLKPPTVGESFVGMSQALEEGKDFRLIQTSPVQSVQKDTDYATESLVTDTYVFKTLNSTYRLEMYPQWIDRP